MPDGDDPAVAATAPRRPGEAEIRVLGPVELWLGPNRQPLGGPRQRAVLGRLVLARGSVVATERLIDDVWSGNPPPKATGVLQAHISTLRRALEPNRIKGVPATTLVSHSSGYALTVRSDADQFAELLDAGVSSLAGGDSLQAKIELDRAIALWTGTPYGDLADEPWVAAEIGRLVELKASAHEHRLAAALELGELHTAIPELERLVVEFPLREELWRLLALALYRSGRQGESLASLRRARTMLTDELGVDPSPRLQSLEAAVLGQSKELDAPRRPAASGGEHHPTHRERAPGEPQRPPIGREVALADLTALAANAVDSGHRSAVLTGDPGIGKTRLSEALVEHLEADGWTAVWGRCFESAGAPALWPWLQVLERLDAIVPLPADLGRLRAGQSRAPVPDAAEARFLQHQAIGNYLSRAAAKSPLLIILEDAQWADAASLALLAELPDLARDAAILTVVTVRSQLDNASATDALSHLGRYDALRLKLEGLTTDDIARLIAGAGVNVDPAELTRRTAGNPFLLRETLRELERVGTARGIAHVPVGAAVLLRRRVQQLSPAAQSVLGAAAVYGAEIDTTLLGTLCELTDADIADALDAATAAGILVAAADDALRFAHDLVRETIYADLAPTHKSRLHAGIVGFLEEHLGADPATVAAHAAAAGPVLSRSALRWSVRAAEQATSRRAYEDAARWWSRALHACEQSRPPDRVEHVELLLRLVRAQVDCADAAGASETRDAAVRAAHLTGDPSLLARALTAVDVPNFPQYGQTNTAIVDRLEEALESDLAEAASGVRSRLLATLASELTYLADPRRPALAFDALAHARSLDDPRLLAFCLNVRCLTYDCRFAHVRDAVAIGRELVDLGETHELPSIALIGHLTLMTAELRLYEVASADWHAATANRLIRRARQPLTDSQYELWLGNRQALDGHFDQAEQTHARLGRTAAGLSARWTLAVSALFHHLWSDRMAEVGPLLDTIGAAHPALRRDAELLMLVAQGQTHRAAELAARTPWPKIGDDWVRTSAWCLRSVAASALGDVALQRAAYDELLPGAGLICATARFAAGPVDLYLGRLALAMEDPAAAAGHFTTLYERSAGSGFMWWSALAERERDRLGRISTSSG